MVDRVEVVAGVYVCPVELSIVIGIDAESVV